MSRWWFFGNALLTLGLGWVAFYSAMVSLHPTSWGGPNIGGGMTMLVAYALCATGIGFIVGEIITARARRANPEVYGRGPWFTLRTAVVVPAGISLAAAVVCVVMVVSPPGPGGSGRVGAVGLTVDADGDPVLVLVVCERSVDTVTLYGAYRGDEGNHVFATLLAPSGGVSKAVELPLGELPAGWSGGPVTLPLEATSTDLIIASGRGEESYLSQLSFSGADLGGMSPDAVLFDGVGFTGRSDAAASVCG